MKFYVTIKIPLQVFGAATVDRADNADVPTQICTDYLRKSALNLFISVISVPFFICDNIFFNFEIL